MSLSAPGLGWGRFFVPGASVVRPAPILTIVYRPTGIDLQLTSAQALGPLELTVMEVLWGHIRPLTVRQVHRALGEHDLAYTMIMTTMVRLCEKGMLSRSTINAGIECGGRGMTYCYTAIVSKGALLAAAIDQLCREGTPHAPQELFGGTRRAGTVVAGVLLYYSQTLIGSPSW